MNFGQNLYNWFLSNAQSLVLMAIVVIGIYQESDKFGKLTLESQVDTDNNNRHQHKALCVA